MSDNIVIELQGVNVAYEHHTVLRNVNFRLRNGEFAYLIGETGAGKSSFLKLLYRDVIPDSGTVRVAGYEVTRLSQRKVSRLRRSMGIVFQDFQLLPDRDVYENIAFALHATGAARTMVKQRVLEVLNMVGLSHKRKNMPDDLSGGEQQRIVIARALVNEPRIMLADEPTGNLDPEASKAIMRLFQKINDRGMAVLMVTHNYQMVHHFPHRTVKLHAGHLKELENTAIG